MEILAKTVGDEDDTEIWADEGADEEPRISQRWEAQEVHATAAWEAQIMEMIKGGGHYCGDANKIEVFNAQDELIGCVHAVGGTWGKMDLIHSASARRMSLNR